VAAPDYDYECFGQSIGGIWHGCGCVDCDQAEDDAIEADAESGAISDAQARAQHEANDYARGADR
jgi:hypothetical protein